jgi:hypothetical protein
MKNATPKRDIFIDRIALCNRHHSDPGEHAASVGCPRIRYVGGSGLVRKRQLKFFQQIGPLSGLGVRLVRCGALAQTASQMKQS